MGSALTEATDRVNHLQIYGAGNGVLAPGDWTLVTVWAYKAVKEWQHLTHSTSASALDTYLYYYTQR